MKQAVAVLAVLFFGSAGARAAGDRIWSALVLATREEPAAPLPRALESVAPVIQKVFGYNSLYLLGEKYRELVTGGQEWLVPSRDFFFKVQCLSQETTSYLLRIELYRDQRLLVTTEVKLARDAPLYIRGPGWGRGQLILLLEVR